MLSGKIEELDIAVNHDKPLEKQNSSQTSRDLGQLESGGQRMAIRNQETLMFSLKTK